MRELRRIVERWHEGSAMILVTLVRIEGSSYRQPGARLIVCNDGTYEGGISAGCLEADLLRKASWLIRNGAAVERYSTLFDEEAEMPYGLGCGGVLDILLESTEAPECQALLKAIEASVSGREQLVATWLPNDEHTMMRAVFDVDVDGALIFASEGLSQDTLSHARMKYRHKENAKIEGVFFERLAPPQRLFVFGAGDDAKPLATMAWQLGWSVTVIDGRAHLARKTRFPESNIEVVSSPHAAIQQITSRDAIVIMTHSYDQDREYLASILPLRPVYLGLLGSRQRSSLLIAEAAATLAWPVSRCCEHLSAPIGMDIGGEGPEAIALAILAEAQACCADKRDASRKLSADRVESYLASADARNYRHAQCGLDTV
jgi:xanthine/CO dehydrogenase XdhC/CoxF family maturation factor